MDVIININTLLSVTGTGAGKLLVLKRNVPVRLCKIFFFKKVVVTPSSLSDDDHWVVDTDYDNYAIHYSCRLLDTDGTCLDSYSFIFSRHPTGLRPEDQPIVTQKKMELCLLGKYRRVAHTGEFICLCKYLLIHVFYESVSPSRMID